jgi:hypothetical protein
MLPIVKLVHEQGLLYSFYFHKILYRSPCFVIWAQRTSVCNINIQDKMFYGIIWCRKIIILKSCTSVEVIPYVPYGTWEYVGLFSGRLF